MICQDTKILDASRVDFKVAPTEQHIATVVKRCELRTDNNSLTKMDMVHNVLNKLALSSGEVYETSSRMNLLNSMLVKFETMREEDLLKVSQFADDFLKPRPVGVQLVLQPTKRLHSTCFCGINFKMSDGSLVPLDMPRQSTLVYVFTLLNPQGVRRTSLLTENEELKVLFSRLYHLPRFKMPHLTDKNLPQVISNSRAAIMKALGDDALSRSLMIDSKSSRLKNMLVIPFVMNGGLVEKINFN